MSDVFIKILNMSISASWLILAVIVIRMFLKKAPKWCICFLWGIVGLRLIFPFSLESIYSLIPSNEVIPENITTEVHPQIHSGITYVDAAVNPVLKAHLSTQAGDSANPMQVVVHIASLMWCTGLTICLLYALISFILLKLRVRASKKIMNNVYVCDEVKSPFILGVFRPVIYIPSGMSRETLDYVTDHENAHLKRGDHFWKPLGFIILSVYWFHPLCWIAYILLCKDIEFACDEKVIRDKDHAYANLYSQALLDCNVHRRVIAACPLAFGETGVKNRIKNVLNYKKPAFRVIVIAVIICIAVAICFMTDPKKNSEKSIVEEAEKEETETNVYSEVPVKDIGDKFSLGDINQNGVEDYIVSNSDVNSDKYAFLWELFLDGEKIYQGTNELPCAFEEAWYIDLDDDGEKEVFVKVYPYVNSMPQIQYVALKKSETGWKELENTDSGYDSDHYTNEFPIRVLSGEKRGEIAISCDGCDDIIQYDVTGYYRKLYDSDDGVLKAVAQDILFGSQYNSPGITVGSPAAWGVWDLSKSSFDGKDCIIATHGIQGLGGKFDMIGTADVYFKYDNNGKIRIVGLTFTPYE